MDNAFAGAKKLKNITNFDPNWGHAWTAGDYTYDSGFNGFPAHAGSPMLEPSSDPPVAFSPNIYTARNMFSECVSLEYVENLEQLDISKTTDVAGMFDGCSNLQLAEEVKDWDFSSIASTARMFANTRFANPNVHSFNVHKVTSMQSMFENNEYFLGLGASSNVENWNVASVQDMSFMFKNTVLAQPNIFKWNVAKVLTFEGMFEGAQNALVHQRSPDYVMFPGDWFYTYGVWNLNSVTSLKDMFKNARVADPNPAGWTFHDRTTAKNYVSLESMFEGAEKLRFPGVDV
jgi:hypothetical protein